MTWQQRDSSGRYQKSHPCDACNKPAGRDYITDADVCGSGDGPGFMLCDRARCVAKRSASDVATRRIVYTAMVAARPHRWAFPVTECKS